MIKDKWYREICIMLCVCAAVLAVLIYAYSVYSSYPEAGTGEYRLAVIETSDVHGALTSGEDPDYEYRVAYIADKVNDARQTEDGIDTDRLVLLDGGDIYQGSAVSLLSQGEAMSAVFDEMQYDAVAVGNHEFDWSVDDVIDADRTMRDYELDGRSCKNDTPVICCDLYKDGEKVSFARDYVILDKKAADETGALRNVRIGVIGFVEDYTLSIPEKNFTDLGYSIVPDYDEANRLAEELKGDKRCDAVILLTHGAPDKAAEGLGSSSCVDLVLGGHIHKSINDETDWGLRYMSPSGNAYSYDYDELVFENDGKGGVQISADADDRAENVFIMDNAESLLDNESNAEELDRGAVDLTNEYISRVQPVLEEEIGYFTESVTKDMLEGSGNRISTASNFACDAMRRSADVEAAFINKTCLRANFYITEGSGRHVFTQGDLFSLIPFDDRLYVYEITYGELLDVLSFSMNGGGFNLLTCMSGIDCYFKDDPDADQSGKYKVTMVDALVKDGELIYHDGRWKEGWKDKKIRIAVNDMAAEAEKTKQGYVNPLYGYNSTDRLLSNDVLIRDAVGEGLRAEAAANGGQLKVSKETCYKYQPYEGPDEL